MDIFYFMSYNQCFNLIFFCYARARGMIKVLQIYAQRDDGGTRSFPHDDRIRKSQNLTLNAD